MKRLFLLGRFTYIFYDAGDYEKLIAQRRCNILVVIYNE